MDWIKVLYWIATAILWALIVMNFRSLCRNHRLYKEYGLLIDDLKRRLCQLETLRGEYLERLKMLEEKQNETDAF